MGLNSSENKLPDDLSEENKIISTNDHFKCTTFEILQRLHERVKVFSQKNSISVKCLNTETSNEYDDIIYDISLGWLSLYSEKNIKRKIWSIVELEFKIDNELIEVCWKIMNMNTINNFWKFRFWINFLDLKEDDRMLIAEKLIKKDSKLK